jgi:hypothetical protein
MRETPDRQRSHKHGFRSELGSMATKQRGSNFYAIDTRVAHRAGVARTEDILSAAKGEEEESSSCYEMRGLSQTERAPARPHHSMGQGPAEGVSPPVPAHHDLRHIWRLRMSYAPCPGSVACSCGEGTTNAG